MTNVAQVKLFSLEEEGRFIAFRATTTKYAKSNRLTRWHWGELVSRRTWDDLSLCDVYCDRRGAFRAVHRQQFMTPSEPPALPLRTDAPGRVGAPAFVRLFQARRAISNVEPAVFVGRDPEDEVRLGGVIVGKELEGRVASSPRIVERHRRTRWIPRVVGCLARGPAHERLDAGPWIIAGHGFVADAPLDPSLDGGEVASRSRRNPRILERLQSALGTSFQGVRH